MEFRLLAPLKIRVSAVGFGTWPLTGVCEIDGKPVGRGEVDETAARTALHAALDADINFPVARRRQRSDFVSAIPPSAA